MPSVEVRAIFAFLERLLYILLSILGVAEALGIKLDRKAEESTPFRSRDR
jgi:hypothetical protein